MVQYYQQPWLPPLCVSTDEEANRFQACVRALHDHVAALKATPRTKQEPNAWQGVLQWVPILNNLLDVQEDAYRLEDVLTCIHVLIDIVLNTSDDIEVQARAAQALASVLDAHKLRLSRRFRDEDGMLPAEEPKDSDVLRLRLEWRPWLDLLLSLMDDPPPSVEGFVLSAVRQQSLLRVVALACRYFAPDAAFEIWRLLGPSVESVGYDQAIAYDALGWVSLFTPTFCISSCEPGALNQLVGAWMEGWKRMPNSPPWNALWLSLLSRAAKHDYKGAIDWGPHLDILFTNFIGAFDVPVGAATSFQATVRSAPAKALMHHNQNVGPEKQSKVT
ncbi:hypothetical protein DUNSADRAFT_13104 [Dunaliella salina]|uniref:Uncharacterized protein n=1 Tax=Dunaliella salina TaxID=3046 RepID=A0ABQ7GA29_DUNSA|nr:hypothetical protein DUNSADRAFT_13104 [Dunaliella salina]|eukprot:KAF5831464.1 hypothetical protein DUNSADRAFT_13104 [Dunaliella salina]